MANPNVITGIFNGTVPHPQPPHPVDPPSFYDPWEGIGAPDFPLNVLHPDFEKLIDFVATDLGVERAIAMAFIAAFNAALDQQTRINVKRNGTWQVPPRLWLALVGDPSTKKWPIFKKTMAPLQKINSEIGAHSKREHDEWEETAAQGKADKRPIPKAPNQKPQLITNDSTVEALAEIMSRNPQRGTTIFREALSGIIGQMDRYSNTKGGDRAYYLEMFDGGPFTRNRVSKPDVTVNNCSANVIGGIQPDKLREMIKDLQTDGFMQRMVPVMLGRASAGTDEPDRGGRLTQYEKVIRWAYNLPPCDYHFSDEALKVRDRVLEEIELLKQVDLWGSGFQQWAGKLAVTFASVCLTLFLSDLAFDIVAGARPPLGADELFDPCFPVGVAERAATIVLDYIVKSAMCYHSSIYGDETTQGLANFVLTSDKDRFVPSDF